MESRGTKYACFMFHGALNTASRRREQLFYRGGGHQHCSQQCTLAACVCTAVSSACGLTVEEKLLWTVGIAASRCVCDESVAKLCNCEPPEL